MSGSIAQFEFDRRFACTRVKFDKRLTCHILLGLPRPDFLRVLCNLSFETRDVPGVPLGQPADDASAQRTQTAMFDARALTGPGGVVLERNTPLEPFKRWAAAARQHGARIWM